MQTLVLMLKEPRAGRVKTRLGRDIGMTAAAWWFRHNAQGLIRRLQDPRWHMVLAVSPDRAGLTSRVWPAHLPRITQGTGDLGQRMTRVFHSVPRGRVCIMGADILGVTPQIIAQGFRSLGSSDACFGPAEDGGYWLIGLNTARGVPHGLFNGVRWSTEHALNDTRRSLAGRSIAQITPLRDVDTAADLHL